MKKIFTTGFLAISFFALSQNTEKLKDYFPKNEIKLNVIYPFWGKAELSYERSLGSHSSIGTSAFLDFTDTKNSFLVSPYYRYYLGAKPQQGFYLEGQIMFSASNNTFFSVHSKNNGLLFGAGLGIGYKLVLKNNWLLDANVSYGTFFNASKDSSKDYFRPGLSFGKRF